MSTAATIHDDVQAAARTLLLTVAGLPAVAWQGKAYQPVKGKPWISEALVPGPSLPRSLGEGGTISHRIIISLSLHYPPNEGTKALGAMAGALLQKFKPGTFIDQGVVMQAERRSLISEPDWLSTSVLITVVAYTTN